LDNTNLGENTLSWETLPGKVFQLFQQFNLRILGAKARQWGAAM